MASTKGATTVHTTDDTTTSGARKRLDRTIIGQLNVEWARLRNDPATVRTVTGWASRKPALAGAAGLVDIETRTTTSRQAADSVLLALLELAHDGDQLAGRTVLQLMLGKAVRIAASRTGRTDRDTLEQLAVTALWDVIAAYPIDRRRQKVAANLAMDTLHQVVAELRHDRHETPTDSDVLGRVVEDRGALGDGPADAELVEVVMWGVESGVIGREDAVLLVRVYCTGADNPGGAAVAAEFGLSWAAARQRCSRAVRKLAAAVHADTSAAA